MLMRSPRRDVTKAGNGVIGTYCSYDSNRGFALLRIRSCDKQLTWQSEKSVYFWSCRLGFDSMSGQTNHFPALVFTIGTVFTASLLDAQH